MNIDNNIKPVDLISNIKLFWELSGKKILDIEKHYDTSKGSPVYTANGKYTSKGWTEWTQGFQYGSAILQFDATDDNKFLEIGRSKTLDLMAPHISHFGVHDHGFNNLSTYGNLLRLMQENRIPYNNWENNFYKLALKISGAVQAYRWTKTHDGGFIYSFNGPHSLFVDTIRSCRILGLSHILGHILYGENDEKISLLKRMTQHILSTAKYSVFYGEGRDKFDVCGRVAHECIFNTNDGNFRSVNSQQGYTGLSTWTRGLAWAMLGFTEQLEFIESIKDEYWNIEIDSNELISITLKAAESTCDFYIENTPNDGIPYWDTGAPYLHKLGDYLNKPSNPYNDYEPVDSSAATIGAQGLFRLGHYLLKNGSKEKGKRYFQAGLTILKNLLKEPYLSFDDNHQGLILHSIYHHPNGWDNIPEGSKIPHSESSMWGDYHAREVVLYLTRILDRAKYYSFFNGII